MRFALGLAAFAASLPACQDGPFGAPPGDFFCGTQACEISTHYCVLAPAADAGTGESAVCAALPDACTDGPTCACVASVCAGTCQTGSDGSITLTCP